MLSGSRRRSQSGVTYFGVLILVTLIGLSLSLAAKVVSHSMQRDNEQQLLWVGHAYRTAIETYYRKHGRYPTDLGGLLAEPTGTIAEHYLRALYPDPMTNTAEWTLLRAPDGGLMGVASRSGKVPIKTANFDDEDVDFDKAATYADWTFTYDPMLKKTQPRPPVFGAPVR